ncbi:AAA family ATPase [Halorussus pelagicus]|uniref:AAA family ATPase n=1 Tax=Halorussus pelagicus TaxID=2505977 RepID=UPI000FFB9B50|nr:ATP-binding protein [Halorussus pelagicus]
MTELEHVEIEGFKGLEYVEFEPTDINLITGRNNTGKTSFLEAVNLAFDLSYVNHFERKVDKLINVDAAESRIRVQRASNKESITIRRPTIAEAKGHLVKTLIENLSFQREGLHEFGFQARFDTENDFVRVLEERTDMDSVTVGTEIETGLKQTVTTVLDQSLRGETADRFSEECLVFEKNGEQFPYVYFQDLSDVLRNHYDEIGRAFEREIKAEFEAENLRTPDEHGDLIYPGGDRDKFFEFLFDQPPDEGQFLRKPTGKQELLFIKSRRLTERDQNIDPEEHAIKIDDIGDYVKETELIDGLKTFNLDYLVFEEDGEKHDIPYDFMGDGFKSIVGLLWELMDDDVENEIVLLEEPETHMHPGYVREVVYFLIDLAREEDVQLFITTHDSDFINDFFTENLTDEEEAYLEDEFSLLRMEEDDAVVEDYETARENLKDLHLDLRGI